MVTVWKREAEKVEVQELGYLSVLQQREPTHTFRHDLNTFKAQGKTHTYMSSLLPEDPTFDPDLISQHTSTISVMADDQSSSSSDHAASVSLQQQ